MPPLPTRNGWFGEVDPGVTPDQTALGWGADHVIRLLHEAAARDQPFFLRWDPKEPHLPNLLPEPFASLVAPAAVPPSPSFPDPLFGKPYIQRQQVRTWGLEGWGWQDWAPIVARYLGEVALGHTHYEGDPNQYAAWPWTAANCGDIDICGCRRPQSYYREIVFGAPGKVACFVATPVPEGRTEVVHGWGWHNEWPSWTWPGEEGKPLTVRVYSSCPQVRLLLNSTAEAIYGIDLQGNCTFANQACLRILGYQDIGQLLGKNMHDLSHHSYPNGTPMAVKDCRIYQSFREGKGVQVDDEVLWKADGSSFAVEYFSYPQIVAGVVYNPVADKWSVSSDMDVNYMVVAEGM